MEELRPSREVIIDALVAAASPYQFLGDCRDTDAPPINLENFFVETFRYGAIALRTRLSQLPYKGLLEELFRSADYLKSKDEQLKNTLEHGRLLEIAEAARAMKERQSELGRRHGGLQETILLAAQHFRGGNKSASQAWRTIKQNPYEAANGKTVRVEGDDEREVMRVLGGNKKQRAIKRASWERRYWRAAEKADRTG